jgi:hypothetical protein
MENNLKIDEFIKKVQESKTDKLDLSLNEDLSIAIMNLVSIEEHFFFFGAKTGKPEYFDLLQEARKMRGDLLRKIVKEEEGFEKWCISKHLLATSMRLMEVGTKYNGDGKKQEAQEMFKKAYELYSLFWGINLKLVDMGDVKKIEDNQIGVKDENKKMTIMEKLGKVVKYAIDCCKE